MAIANYLTAIVAIVATGFSGYQLYQARGAAQEAREQLQISRKHAVAAEESARAASDSASFARLLAKASERQVQTLDRSVEVARSGIALSERQQEENIRLAAKQFRPKIFVSVAGTDTEAGKRPLFTATSKNVGLGDAVRANGNYTLRYSQASELETVFERLLPRNPGSIPVDLAPSQEFFNNVTLKRTLSEEDMNNLRLDLFHIYFFGYTDYADELGRSHRSHVCWRSGFEGNKLLYYSCPTPRDY